MDQSRPNNGLRLAGMALFSALALAACGGGGGSPAPADNSSLPSNTGSGSGGGSGSGSGSAGPNTPANTQSVFTAAETSQSNGSTTTRQLVVVDTRNHTAVLKLDLPAHSAAGADWYVSDRYSASTGAVTAQVEGASQLYVIQNGHVTQIDLSGSTLGTPKTISSVSDACGFERTGFIELNLDGKQSWLEVTTAGPDGKCDQTTDNTVMLVASSMDSTQAALPGGKNGLDLIETLQDSLASPATGILALDRRTATLGVYSTDLKSRLYTVAITDHVITSGERAQSIGHLPLPPNQTLVQLGSSLYVSGTNNGQLVLGTPVLQLANPNSYPTSTGDSNNFYLANGTQLLLISRTGVVTKIGDLSATAGDARGMWTSQSSVLVQQAQDVAQNGSAVGATLTSFSKSGEAPVVLAQGNSTEDAQVVGVVADTVFYRQATPNTYPLSDIFQIPARGGTSSTVASGVFLSAYMWSPQVRLNGLDVVQAVWCQPVNGQDCSNAPLVSYNLSSGQKITLGTVPLDTGWSNVLAYTLGEPFAARTNLMGLWRHANTAATYQQDVALWTYNAGTANSLTRVTTP